MGVLSSLFRAMSGSKPIVVYLDPRAHTWHVLEARKDGEDWFYANRKKAVQPAQVWHRDVFFEIADKRMILVTPSGPLGVVNDEARILEMTPDKYAAGIKTRKIAEYLGGGMDWKILVIIGLIVALVFTAVSGFA